MLDHLRSFALFSLAEQNYLRLEAMDLFERCLTEGCPDYLTAFIEQQLTQEPPRIELLQDVAQDLHQRLLGLREYHFDVRDRVLRTLRNDFQVDLSDIAPSDALARYHLLNPEHVLQYACNQNPHLKSRDQYMLRKILEASLDMASQLSADIEMTEDLFSFVMDWSDGLSTTAARRYWLHTWEASPHSMIQ